jgi:hypothetical protein
MKTLNRFAMLATATAVLSSFAYGQSPILKANVPFEFRTATAGVLPSGEYVIRDHVLSGANIESLRHVSSNRTVNLMASAEDSLKRGSAALFFSCSTEGCALVGMRTSQGTITYAARKKSKHVIESALVTIPLETVKAD